MNDQAQSLRRQIGLRDQAATRRARLVTVTSGKGGVGKSNFTLNFALSLQRRGSRVLVFDADFGLANLDLLMGMRPEYTLYHLLKKQKTMREIVHTGPEGLPFVAGGSGFTELVRLSEADLDEFSAQIAELAVQMDYILFDTGAGLSRETLKFIVSADETIVVTTPEPTSVTDAYAIMKMIKSHQYDVHYRLVINRVTSEREGKTTADNIVLAAQRFLGVKVEPLGFVYDDPHVPKAVKKQVPFTIEYPHCAAAKGAGDIAERFLSGTPSDRPSGGMRGFLQRMTRMLLKDSENANRR